jgi:hypothetical protein
MDERFIGDVSVVIAAELSSRVSVIQSQGATVLCDMTGQLQRLQARVG